MNDGAPFGVVVQDVLTDRLKSRSTQLVLLRQQQQFSSWSAPVCDTPLQSRLHWPRQLRRVSEGDVILRVGLFIIVMLVGPVACAWGATARVSPPVFFQGMCDASAAVALDDSQFVVADDEDSVLRIYQTDQPGFPVRQLDMSHFLELDKKKPETDLEGAARVGNRIYWITSHSRNRNGIRRQSRERFFATEIVTGIGGAQVVPIGKPYKSLVRDLLGDARLKRFGLAAASRRAPKEPNAFNVEGLCARPNGSLLIGFRNPIPNGKALLVPMLNPGAIVAGSRAKFGDPILLDLGGLGIREIAERDGRFLIVAGSFNGQGESRLFEWAGGAAVPKVLAQTNVKEFNPEAIVFYPARGWREIQILSDDGTRSTGGINCKDISDPAQRRFRSEWLTLDDGTGEATRP